MDEYWHVLRAGKNFLSTKAKEETITNFLYQKDKQNQKIYDKVGKTSAWWQTLRVLTNPLKNTLMEEWIQNTKRQFERLNTNGQWLRAVRHIFMLRFSLSNNPRSTHLKDGYPILGGYGEVVHSQTTVGTGVAILEDNVVVPTSNSRSGQPFFRKTGRHTRMFNPVVSLIANHWENQYGDNAWQKVGSRPRWYGTEMGHTEMYHPARRWICIMLSSFC